MLRLLALLAVCGASTALQMSMVLIIGGTRFSGAYLWRELNSRGHHVTLYNRGKTAPTPIPGESAEQFQRRLATTSLIVGDRKVPEELMEKVGAYSFDVCYDMNGREASDTEPLLNALKRGSPGLQHFIYMSSAGVYLKSEKMPHKEGDEVDYKSRHKGKLETEELLARSGMPWTSFRPTYIYGAGNYNPLEQFFFERIQAGRPVCVPGYGGHLTGLGHVRDLAVAMANVIGRPHCIGKTYNCQDDIAITFDGLVRACAVAAGKSASSVEIVHYNPKDFDFGKKKAFPLRPQHFWTDVELARRDLDWEPLYDTSRGLRDAYENEFVIKLREDKLKNDFECDDMILAAAKKRSTATPVPSSRAPASTAPAAPQAGGSYLDMLEGPTAAPVAPARGGSYMDSLGG